MFITFSKEAVERLKSVELEKGNFPRIDATMGGSCGLSVNFSLIFDEARRNDLLFEEAGIKIRIDHFAKRYLQDDIYIDYTDEHGFVIGESYDSGACSLEI